MAKVIVISGKAEHGKDTTAGFLQTALEDKGKKVLILHWADYLKFMCKQYFGWSGNKDEEGRKILQYVGTEVVRAKEPTFWVDTLIRFMKLFESEYDYFIIPDTRFPNEVESPKEAGFDTLSVRVVRPGFENSLTEIQRNHASELALDNYSFDAVLKSTTLEESKAKAGYLANILERNEKEDNEGIYVN